MQITKKEWIEKVEEQLLFMPGLSRVTLFIDGYKIELHLSRIKKTLSFNIILFVNDHISPQMMMDTSVEYHDIQKRFLRKAIFRGRSISLTKKNIRDFGKKWIVEHNKKNERIYYGLTWLSFSSLYNHLIKNNTSIEIACQKCNKVHTDVACGSVSDDQSIN